MLTALITGGSRGIGAQTVRAFASAGYRVAFFYLNSEAAAQALSQETGAIAIRCDVRDAQSVRMACAEAVRQLSHIDVLVSNAGVDLSKLEFLSVPNAVLFSVNMLLVGDNEEI